MALTYTRVARVVAGNERTHIVDIVADATYSTGGYALTSADYASLGRSGAKIGDFLSLQSEENVGGTGCVLDRTNEKLLFFLGATECTTTISSKTVRVRIGFGYSNYK